MRLPPRRRCVTTDLEPGEYWAILELMGHRRLAGLLSEQTIAGGSFIRLDVPHPSGDADDFAATQFYSPSAVYCITPTSEATARLAAKGNHVAPVQRWELPAAEPPKDWMADDDD